MVFDHTTKGAGGLLLIQAEFDLWSWSAIKLIDCFGK